MQEIMDTYHKNNLENREWKGLKGCSEMKELKGMTEYQDKKDHKKYKECKDPKGLKEHKDLSKDKKENNITDKDSLKKIMIEAMKLIIRKDKVKWKGMAEIKGSLLKAIK